MNEESSATTNGLRRLTLLRKKGDRAASSRKMIDLLSIAARCFLSKSPSLNPQN